MKFSNIELFAGGENARIQSFLDEWQFCGSMAKQYKQIGNAVLVNLAIDKEIIALELQRQRDMMS
ncbi:DNA cytosine methyltransferase [Candidatus Campylobacter infans]|uniref:DNA cytosine methyltransferase n=1 Tax=Candidatus Campylobacter infans TaxID=2561898 RepID=UPI001962EC1B|nr:DNA cytosine methyltransferase [Candidatus Campylobacter infans]